MAKPTLEQIRSIQWGHDYNWNATFTPSPPFPFDKWVPAHSLDLPLFDVASHQLSGYISSAYKIPISYNASSSIRLSFYGDEKGVLEAWFQDWVKAIFNDGKYISTIGKISRTLHIERTDSGGKEIPGLSHSYRVYPEGSARFSGTSSSDATSFDVEFVIVGE